jgi:hypothetical protein
MKTGLKRIHSARYGEEQKVAEEESVKEFCFES